MSKLIKLPEQPKVIAKQILWKHGKQAAKDFLMEVEKHPAKYFCPNLVQERIIREFAKSAENNKISTCLFTCGNGVGKTTVSINILINLIYGAQNGWFDYPIFRHWPFPKHIWLVTTPSNIKKNYFSIDPDAASLYKYLIGKEGVDWITKKDQKSYIVEVSFPKHGWTVSIFSYNQAPSEFEGATVGGFLLDEPSPKPIWDIFPSRMRKGGVYLMPMTPLDCEPYIKDEVIERAESGERGFIHVSASSWEVTTDKERGHYDPDVLASQIKRMAPDTVRARVHGELMYFKETMYPTLNYDLHCVDPIDYPIPSSSLFYHIIDPGDGKPNAEIWCAITPDGRKMVFHEAPEDQSQAFWDMTGCDPINAHMRNVQFIEEQLSQKLGFRFSPTRVMDYHFGNQTRGVDKKTAIDAYRQAGWRNLQESYKGVGSEGELVFGHNKVRESLQLMPHDGKPGLVVWNTCYHTWQGMTHYVRKRAKTESEMMKRAGSGKIVEKFKDFPDVVRYFVCVDWYRPFVDYDKYKRRPKRKGLV